ncbi:palindromic element RPE3 domain-containing protein [Rickettsia endosymbiont of Halotydeus destructor]
MSDSFRQDEFKGELATRTTSM